MVYVSSGTGIIIENVWQGILRLFPPIEPFVFLGYLNQWEKIHKCLFNSISSPLERKTLYIPPLLDPLPLGSSVTLRGGYGYFLKPHIIFFLFGNLRLEVIPEPPSQYKNKSGSRRKICQGRIKQSLWDQGKSNYTAKQKDGLTSFLMLSVLEKNSFNMVS